MPSRFSDDERSALKKIFGPGVYEGLDSGEIVNCLKTAMERKKKKDSGQIGRDFEATRKRIREIEAAAMKKLMNSRDNPPDDVA